LTNFSTHKIGLVILSGEGVVKWVGSVYTHHMTEIPNTTYPIPGSCYPRIEPLLTELFIIPGWSLSTSWINAPGARSQKCSQPISEAFLSFQPLLQSIPAN
jgi:hypothetical protein